MMTLETTVGEMVVERPSRARVFERHRIDYCCGGKMTLSAACARRGLDPQQVLAEIEANDQAVAPDETDWNQSPLPSLVDHLLDTHHVYLREAMERLAFLAEKVARVHGEHHPELQEVHGLFEKFRQEMIDHMAKEEQILFPAIGKLVEGSDAPFPFPIDRPIGVMNSEHEEAGRDLERLRDLTSGYRLPEDACNSYRALFSGLSELEQDTFQHIHKESNILFPRAIALLDRAGSRA
jgi:regulator of cell morphogenesis and NO signaling